MYKNSVIAILLANSVNCQGGLHEETRTPLVNGEKVPGEVYEPTYGATEPFAGPAPKARSVQAMDMEPALYAEPTYKAEGPVQAWESFEGLMEEMPEIGEMSVDDLQDPEMMYTMAEDWAYEMDPELASAASTYVSFNDNSNSTNSRMITFDAEQMRQDFRDYFGFAILGNVWNINDVSTCGDACSGDYDKCCFNVYMTDRNTNATNNENYCMI